MKTSLAVAFVCGSLVIANGQDFTAHLDGAQDGGGTRQGVGDVTFTLSGVTLSLASPRCTSTRQQGVRLFAKSYQIGG